MGINRKDQVVGNYSDLVTGNEHGFLLSGGVLTTLDFPGARQTNPNAINDLSVIVGGYDDSSFKSHGFVYFNGTFTTLDFPGSTDTDVFGISNDDDIVGGYNDASGEHGFLYRASTGNFFTIDYAGSVPTGKTVTDTVINGVNEEGSIVGTYTLSDGSDHAFKAKLTDPD